MQKWILPLTLISTLCSWSLEGQQIIEFQNPSFEGMPRHSHPPSRWFDCGFSSETPPDIQPGAFDVSTPAFDGDTYLGMVVRDNDTWEAVSQKLEEPLLADSCYQFSLMLMRAHLYISGSRTTNQDVNYTTPAKLRIWGGADYCDQAELLATSTPVFNNEWMPYFFTFSPTESWEYIILEAFFEEEGMTYNGNICVDFASPIYLVECGKDSIVIPNRETSSNSIKEEALEEKMVEGEKEKRKHETLESPEELEALIMEMGPSIGFYKQTTHLLSTKHIKKRFPVQTLEFFGPILNNLKNFPDYKLLLHVKNNPKGYTDLRMEKLHIILENNNIPPNQYSILRFDKKAKTEYLSENQDLAIQLLKINNTD